MLLLGLCDLVLVIGMKAQFGYIVHWTLWGAVNQEWQWKLILTIPGSVP